MVKGERHGDTESWTGGAWYVNGKDTSWGAMIHGVGMKR